MDPWPSSLIGPRPNRLQSGRLGGQGRWAVGNCGKSTLLRCLNRLELFDEGRIRIGDLEVRGSATERLSARAENDLVNRVRLRVGIPV
jgi:ABC-type polar amino acid transport system ATPase subunit